MQLRGIFRALRRVPAEFPRGDRLPFPVSVFHVDAGGCDGCAVEIEALRYSGYAPERTGLKFAESPLCTELLVVTGVCTRAMAPVVRAAWEAMPQPIGIVAVGLCAIDGGSFRENYATLAGLQAMVTPTMEIPGCPAAPADILAGLSALIRGYRVTEEVASSVQAG
ncbi:NADH-quinone oxidoreductase subunit B [Acetobacter sp. AN02]|uniref:NADH-quinone oxidoreductase subunit B family protein n=1 Tax=Acetobacter sp. AN02 TaxID=2894186 RepID=UPI0024343B55|nr:NADH-quinone oxidoreductase subunit B [Acetobacter sp. AN02]MDG6095305.1 NADH-quinone oxidoreductase subunit B [Acetobacter sp. AN02]